MRKKPLIIFDNSNDPRGKAYKNNVRQQNMLLRGMLLTPTFVDAAKFAGFKRAADAIRTLDRLTMRADYHNALSEEGIDLNYIVKGIKAQADGENSGMVKLRAYQILLKSLGLENYAKDEETGKGWEDTLLGYVKKQAALPEITSTAKAYEVTRPAIPDSAKLRKKDDELGKELYEQTLG